MLDTSSVSDEDDEELESSTFDEFIVVCNDLHSRTRAPGCVAIKLFTFNASLTMCIEQIYSIVSRLVKSVDFELYPKIVT